jgi:hypothetical protein
MPQHDTCGPDSAPTKKNSQGEALGVRDARWSRQRIRSSTTSADTPDRLIWNSACASASVLMKMAFFENQTVPV